MKKILLIFLPMLFLTTLANAQITVQGTVKDSTGNALDMANVVAINKTTQALDSYSITNGKGQYKLNIKENVNYTLRFSYLGYETVDVDFTGIADATKDVTLKGSTNKLNEVDVTYKMPVTVRGDTVAYDADSFSNGTEKKLEDVLKKLPGVEINADGEVQVEGKAVTKVMVEGKDFFDGDTKIAAKNIPADALDKIEVLHNYNEVSQMKGLTNDDDNIALNIKLKEGKKNFWFGEITGGVGPDSRYLAHPKLFYYNPKYSVNIITDINNIGELPFTTRDFFKFTGGMRNFMSRGGTSFNVSSNDLGISTMQNNKAKSIETKFAALNFDYSVTDAWDLNGFAIYSYGKTGLETDLARTYIQSNQIETSNTQSLQRSKLGLAKLSSTYKPNKNLQLDYDVFLKQSNQDENTDVYTVSDVTDQIHEGKDQKPLSVTNNLNLYYTMGEKSVLAGYAQYLYQDEDPFYNAIRQEQPFQSIIPFDETQEQYNINQARYVKTNKLDAKLDYYYLTGKKSSLNLTGGVTYSHQNFNSYIFQLLDNGAEKDFDEDNLNNDVTYNFSDFLLGVHYKLISGIFTFNPGLTAHTYKATNKQLGTDNTYSLFSVLPDVYVNVQLKKSENIRLNYSMTRQFTDINKVAQGYIFSNYNSLYSGNRDLESAVYHSVSLNYFNFNMFNLTNIFGSLSYNKRMNDFKNNSTIIGINRVGSTINSDFADEVYSGNGRFERTFGKIKGSARANVSYSKFNNIVNDAQSTSKSFTQSYQAGLSTNFTKAPNLELGYNYSVNDYNNNSNDSKYYTTSPFANLEMIFLKDFRLTAEYNYYHYTNDANTVDNKYDFLDSELTYQKTDSKWEYSIQVTNLLNTKQLNQDSFNELYTSTSAYYIQPRYIMFKVKYNL
ncbi:outer membrane beta-barrel protein [Zhouia sp. PK063]|uniref:outer membrane beta-barrel protein n=1 Tax=Zhouia sp. PK063 TaxID=3373602 RepID=UPI00379F4A51